MEIEASCCSTERPSARAATRLDVREAQLDDVPLDAGVVDVEQAKARHAEAQARFQARQLANAEAEAAAAAAEGPSPTDGAAPADDTDRLAMPGTHAADMRMQILAAREAGAVSHLCSALHLAAECSDVRARD